MLDDVELLRRYAHQQDESAFSALVARHVNLVYSAARRQSGGDADFADATRLSGLLSIERLGPVAIGAIPALKEFASQPNR